MKRRRWGSRLAVGSASVCIALLSGEVGLRAFGFETQGSLDVTHVRPVDDPVVDFRRIAHATWSDVDDVEYRTNGQGFRDVEHLRAKPTDTFRVLALSESSSGTARPN
jgi:hypothetical protein